MSTLKIRRFGVALLSALVLISSSFAQPASQPKASPLGAIPGKAPLVLQLRGLEAAPKRLGATLAAALPDLAAPINGMLQGGLKSLPFMDGRDLAAIDLNAPVFLVISSLEDLTGDEPPQPAILLPVKDYAAFKKGVLTDDERGTLKKDGPSEAVEINGKTVYLYPTAGYLVVTTNKDNIAAFLRKDVRLNAVMPEGVAASFLNNDGAVYLSLAAINQQYGDTLQTIKTVIELGLAQGGNIDPKQAEAVKAVFNGLIQGITDGTGLVLATDFKPVGLDLHFHIGFGKETDTSDALAKLTPGPLPAIGTLPKGQLSYAVIKMDEALRRSLEGLTQLGSSDDEKIAEILEESLKEYLGAGLTESLSATSFPAKGIEVAIMKQPAKAKVAMLKIYKALVAESEFQGLPLIAKPKITEKAGTVEGVDFTGVELKIDSAKLLDDPQIPEQAKMLLEPLLKKLVPDSLKLWIGASDKALITVTAPNWEEAKKTATAYLTGKDTLATDKGYQAVRSALPKDANMMLFVDGGRSVASLIETIANVANDSGMVPFQIPVPAAPKGPAGFIGATITLSEGSAQGNLLLSAESIKAIRAVVMPLVQQLRGGIQ
ncbi:hypothetical protein [Tuwongella immobilis]|uniref:DUF3352 domain-containing protein n=1 Tax=Tuwongella immobilis TaxID=692036 RepID=A0A6C2YSI5_9BACT|nr:hypothetical protein [Tuwongella immobilis]VIP04650.1 Uncharacterized protein OS=Singulisphaera acidiphila (strain ATCC BAA-1392 / DSM 18658 / VKM B-2454 / MOB10) GN=Sinac_4595 PE=4 SV=1 [Tuwongella immobilis]VTS06661.1 Uncharacterized protein OS=Singulisphaera acidiphila (strain ATCC BAA-1392 / DSM 18658 / VKM B-2454 / MOB10) GN=Sinac_4595 PE=4 SV=1 [Tuwongella immobilis]